jgi:hypothetical protein
MAFNTEQMMNTAVEESLSTHSIPAPEGEYEAVIDSVGLRVVNRKDSTEALTCDIKWSILDEKVGEITGRSKNFARQTLWLDTTSEGALDTSPGVNIGLGKLREAVGQNRKGKPWSFSMLQGGMAKILVTHRTSDTTGDTFAEVKSVRTMG